MSKLPHLCLIIFTSSFWRRALFSGTPGTSLPPPSLARRGPRGRARASSEVEEASRGLRTSPGAGWKSRRLQARRWLCSPPALGAWLPGQSQRFSARLLACGRGGLPIPAPGFWREELLEEGKGEQMEGLEEHRVAAASLGCGDPDRGLREEDQGLARWVGRSVTRRPLNSTLYPEVKVHLSQELFPRFIICVYIYILPQEL